MDWGLLALKPEGENRGENGNHGEFAGGDEGEARRPRNPKVPNKLISFRGALRIHWTESVHGRRGLPKSLP